MYMQLFLAINISITREIKRYDQNYDFILLLWDIIPNVIEWLDDLLKFHL